MNQKLDSQTQQSFLKALNVISVVNTVLLAISIFSVLFCFFIPIGNTYRDIVNNTITIMRVRAWLIKAPGLLMLLTGSFAILLKTILFGPKYVLETLIKNPWNLLFLILLIWSFVSLIAHGENPYINTEMLGYDFPNEGITGYVAYAGIYMGATMISKEKYKKLLFDFILYSSMVAAVLTVISECSNDLTLAVNGINQMTMNFSGPFVNPNHYGYYLCVVAALALGRFFMEDDLLKSFHYFAFFLVNLVMIGLVNSFGPYLALWCAVIFFTVFVCVKTHKKNESKNFNEITIVIASICFAVPLAVAFNNLINQYAGVWVAVAALTIFMFLKMPLHTAIKVTATIVCTVLAISIIAPDMFFDEAPNFFLDAAKYIWASIQGIFSGDVDNTIAVVDAVTANGRIEIWAEAVKIIKKYPIFGTGPDLVYHEYELRLGPSNGNVPHNEFLHVSAATGLVGGIAYLGGVLTFIVCCFKNIKKMPKSVVITAVCAGAYAVSAVFGVCLPVSEFYFFLMLGLTNAWFDQQKVRKILEGEKTI